MLREKPRSVEGYRPGDEPITNSYKAEHGLGQHWVLSDAITRK